MKTRLLVLITLIFSVLWHLSAAAAQDGRRMALVIGNAKYPDADSPLKEPVGDMKAMADELKHLIAKFSFETRGAALGAPLPKTSPHLTASQHNVPSHSAN